MMENYFDAFRTGTLFLIRTPDTFPVGYADKCMKDMKSLHLDYAAWLETWNCMDGTIWPHPDYPRSSFWAGENRDPLEEVFAAADKYGMAFFPEAGVMHQGVVEQYPEDVIRNYDGSFAERYGRIGLVPACPTTLEYFIAKYDALLDQYGHHPSCRGVSMPCENGVALTYDRNTEKLWRREFSCAMPSPDEIWQSTTLRNQVYSMLENAFLELYSKLSLHLKQKYRIALMHYPLSKVSTISHMQPRGDVFPGRNLSVMNRLEKLDLLNLQLHPPLSDNIYHFKLEVEMLQAVCGRKPNVADTHFYHETCSGKLPEATPKRYVDYVLSTLTPFGISFFCYGFFAPELPLWKKELNPGAKVFNGYAEPDIVARRRENVVKALEFIECLRPLLAETLHAAECAIYWKEDFEDDYLYGSYYREHMFGLYELLQATTVPVIIAKEIPAAPAKIKLLIFHAVKSFSENEKQQLSEFIRNGGKVMVIGNCHPELYDCCGLSVEQTEAVFVRDPESNTNDHWSFTPPSDTYLYTEKNGRPLYLYNTGIPAVTINGNTVYFGAGSAISGFSNIRSGKLLRIMRKLLADMKCCSGVQPCLAYLRDANGHAYVSSDIYESYDGTRKVLLLRNFGVEVRSGSLNWELPAGYRVVESIADGKMFAFTPGGALPEFEHFIALQAIRQ